MKSVDLIGFRDWREWATAIARGRVLEIGAGSGANFSYYDHYARVIAFDPDADMLAEAEVLSSYPGRVRMLRARAEALPFPDHSFDAAVGTLVFCTIPDPDRALAETRRVLKPDAPLRLVEHVRVQNPLVAGLQDLATPLWKPLAGGCHLNRDTLAAVRAAGFEILKVEHKWRGLLIGIDARNDTSL